MFPWIRTRTWIPKSVSSSLSAASLDMRIWIAALLILFLYQAAPEMYRRAIEPRAPISDAPNTGDLAKATVAIRAERDGAIKDLDAATRELERLKRETTTAATPLGTLALDTGEISALRLLLTQLGGAEIIAKSSNIKSLEITKNSAFCSFCIAIHLVFAENSGPFDVSIKEATVLPFASGVPKLTITRNGQDYLDIAIDFALAGPQLHDFRLSIVKRSY